MSFSGNFIKLNKQPPISESVPHTKSDTLVNIHHTTNIHLTPQIQYGAHRSHHHHHNGKLQRDRSEHRLSMHHARPAEARPIHTRRCHRRHDCVALQFGAGPSAGHHICAVDDRCVSDLYDMLAAVHCCVVGDRQFDCENAVCEYPWARSEPFGLITDVV